VRSIGSHCGVTQDLSALFPAYSYNPGWFRPLTVSLTPGTRLGPYEISAPIGVGGMGEVYRATDTNLARQVAIKVLPESMAADAERLARFDREAKTLAALNHPNIAAIYGLERSDGQTALVMELVEGPTLANRIAEGPIPVDDALAVAKQIAEALEAAHEQGIVHRDLKPANIKVRPDGTVKVLDFGLAKAMEPTGALSPGLSQSPTITTPAMTQLGVILGTAAYMSPEQAKGRPADKRSDLWAFGCVLYEMLTGRRVFEADDVSDTLAFILTRQPAWDALPPTTAPTIRRLLRRCLERDPRRRLQAIGDARVDIENVVGGTGDEILIGDMPARVSSDRSRSWWRRALPLILSATIGAVLASLVALAVMPSVRPPLVTRFAITFPEGRQFSGAGRHLVDVSPDGTQLVYTANRQLYRRVMGELDDIPIPGTQNPVGPLSPVFSPDGRWIAFIAVVPGGSAILKIPVGGGTPQTLANLSASPFGMSWSAEGILLGTGGQGIQRVSSNGGMPEVLVSVKAGESASQPQTLPGGDAVVYTRRSANVNDSDASEIVVHSMKSATDKTVIKIGANARYVESGHLVYALGGVLFAAPFDLKQIEVTGEPVPVVNGVRRGAGLGGGGGTAQFSVSRTGTLVYVPGPASLAQATQDLALFDRSGRIEPLKFSLGVYEAPRVSPNGKQIAVSSVDAKEATIWIYELSGTTSPRRLTFGGRNRFPIWSGDSQRVAYQSDSEGDRAIFIQRADGNGPAERLTKPEQGATHVPDSWSPDGHYLLFSEMKGTEISSWLVSVEDKKVSPFGEIRSLLPINAVFSPDGKWVAYQSGRGGDNGVYVQPFPATGAKYQVSKGSAAHHPAWSRDGKEIIYIPAQSNAVVVSVSRQVGFSVSKTTLELPAKGIEGGPGSVRTYDVMPDGRLVGVINTGLAATGAPDSPLIRVVLNWFEELKRLAPPK
jgi:eukaryotic-like serine/threonine-protein kinase